MGMKCKINNFVNQILQLHESRCIVNNKYILTETETISGTSIKNNTFFLFSCEQVQTL